MRSFTIEDMTSKGKTVPGGKGGRFMSMTPSGAARKAFKHAHKKSGTVHVTIYETTSGSAHKSFKYTVTRKYDPVTVERDGVEITYKYTTKVKALK